MNSTEQSYDGDGWVDPSVGLDFSEKRKKTLFTLPGFEPRIVQFIV
jgi:hypothetical protein